MIPSTDEFEIGPEALRALLQDGNAVPVRLIDCREEDEFTICRITGAELVPLSRFAAEAPEMLRDEERPIVIYCHHGMRSMNATHFLRQSGIGKCWSLAGGIDLWSRQIDPAVPRY